MFCPTAIDEFFEKKFSQLDLNFNKRTQLTYKDRVSFEDRVKEAEDSKSRYPNKVPLVIERHKSEKYLPEMDKVNIEETLRLSLTFCFPQIKWLVPQEMSLAQLSGVIKQRLELPPQADQQLFLLIQSPDLGPSIPSLLTSLSSLHNSHSNTDGFLYLHYSSQEAYG